MDAFGAIVLTGIAIAFLGFLGVGLIWRSRPASDITDRDRNERWAAQIKVEEHDLPQMLDAANDYRRKRGEDEVTLEEFETKVGDEQLRILDAANKQLRARANS
jgi:hypothetical protein